MAELTPEWELLLELAPDFSAIDLTPWFGAIDQVCAALDVGPSVLRDGAAAAVAACRHDHDLLCRDHVTVDMLDPDWLASLDLLAPRRAAGERLDAAETFSELLHEPMFYAAAG